MSHHIVAFNDVHFTYADGTHVIKGITTRMEHGESVGIIGANGVGKSTLLLLLCGILTPSQGEIRLGDLLATPKTMPLVRQRIGFVFQNPDDQLFTANVYDDIAFGPRNYGLSPAEVDTRVNAALATVGIAHLKDRACYKLSGGEKRAAAIATALAMEPDILVMDEPSSALDPGSRRRFINLARGFRHTKIIATHDLDMVVDLCERTLILQGGRIVYDGPTRGALGDVALMAANDLEPPFAVQNCSFCGSPKP